MAPLELPGLEVATIGGEAWLESARAGPNEWALAVGTPDARRQLLEAAGRPGAPSLAVAAIDGPAALFRIELDVCGAWVTGATTSGLRPIAVRRAGWVDLRGHGVGAPADDRIGLGPGDALVVTSAPADDDELLDCLLSVSGQAADVIATESGLAQAAVLRVAEASGEEAIARVEAATGMPRDRLSLPGYPLGDQQPDLWHQPPAPPREARLRLPVDIAEIASVRRLLRRLLSSWRLDALVEDGDVELLATETTTNAMRHAATDATVIVRYLGDRIRVEVGDGSSERPRMRKPGDDDQGGRGLPLVEALSSSWGVHETPDGKRVWFEVTTKAGSRAD